MPCLHSILANMHFSSPAILTAKIETSLVSLMSFCDKLWKGLSIAVRSERSQNERSPDYCKPRSERLAALEKSEECEVSTLYQEVGNIVHRIEEEYDLCTASRELLIRSCH